MDKQPQNERKRSLEHFRCYEKQVLGHRIQINVKFFNFTDSQGRLVKRYQYTAIDDATRGRALRIYDGHTQHYAF
jgi:hypothetical protein